MSNGVEKYSVGELSTLRAACVNNGLFGSLAVIWGYHYFLSHFDDVLQDEIKRFVESLDEMGQLQLITGCFVIEGREENPDFLAECPKVLGDIFEAVAGAIFVDSGYSLDKVWSVYSILMQPELLHFESNVPRSPVSMVYESCADIKVLRDCKSGSKYSIVEDNGLKKVCFSIQVEGQIFEGYATKKSFAKQSAFLKALHYLQRLKSSS